MYAIALLQGMVFYGSIATLYRQASGITIFQITLIESISYILCILFEIPWGIVADKIGYKKTMCFCCVLYFASKLVFWRADVFAEFLLELSIYAIIIDSICAGTSVMFGMLAKVALEQAFVFGAMLSLVGLLLFMIWYKKQRKLM